MKTTIAILAAACFSLLGCGGSSSSGGGGLQMPAASGGNYVLDGKYAAPCFDAPTIDSRDFIEIAGGSMAEYEIDYASTDGTCSGAATEHHRMTSNIASTGLNVTTVGWSLDMFAAPAPTAHDGSTMGSSFTYTNIMTEVVTSTWPGVPDNSLAGDRGAIYFIVDDTPGAAVTLYKGECPVDMGEMHDFCMMRPDVTPWVKQ